MVLLVGVFLVLARWRTMGDYVYSPSIAQEYVDKMEKNRKENFEFQQKHMTDIARHGARCPCPWPCYHISALCGARICQFIKQPGHLV